jgi:hypothetical protein
LSIRQNIDDLRDETREKMAYRTVENIFIILAYVRFEILKVVAMKNAVIWDVTPCGSCKN